MVIEHGYTTLYVSFYRYIVPEDYPSNFTATVSSPTSAYLSWEPDDSHSGDVIQYIINVTVVETGERFQLRTETTYIEVTNLRPYRTYVCVIALVTPDGLGPFSTALVVQTLEDGQ